MWIQNVWTQKFVIKEVAQMHAGLKSVGSMLDALLPITMLFVSVIMDMREIQNLHVIHVSTVWMVNFWLPIDY